MYNQAIATHRAWNWNTNKGACTCGVCTAPGFAGASSGSAGPAAAAPASSTPAPAMPPKLDTSATARFFPGLAPTIKPADDPNARSEVQSMLSNRSKPSTSPSTGWSNHEAAAFTIRAHAQDRSDKSKAFAKTHNRQAWDVPLSSVKLPTTSPERRTTSLPVHTTEPDPDRIRKRKCEDINQPVDDLIQEELCLLYDGDQNSQSPSETDREQDLIWTKRQRSRPA